MEWNGREVERREWNRMEGKRSEEKRREWNGREVERREEKGIEGIKQFIKVWRREKRINFGGSSWCKVH